MKAWYAFGVQLSVGNLYQLLEHTIMVLVSSVCLFSLPYLAGNGIEYFFWTFHTSSKWGTCRIGMKWAIICKVLYIKQNRQISINTEWQQYSTKHNLVINLTSVLNHINWKAFSTTSHERKFMLLIMCMYLRSFKTVVY